MQIRKIVSLYFLLLLVASNAYAEENTAKGGTIQGKAIEYGKDQNPIKGLIVTIVSSDDKELTAKTDANGNFEFSNLPDGKYTLKYVQEGFERMRSGSEYITVTHGGSPVLELKMVDWYNRAKRMVNYRFLPILYQVTDNISKRHNLKQEKVDAIQHALQISIETALKQRKDLSTFAINWSPSNVELLEELLSRKDIRAAFTQNLTERPLKDITDFIKERRHRENRASINFSTVWYDQVLSLTADQRQKVKQIRLNLEDDDSWQNVLTKTQKKILMWTNQETTEISIKRQIRNVPNVIIDANIAATKLEELKKKAGMLESDARTKQLVEAIFAAHTAQLGNLNEHASTLLSLAAKEVAKKYLEAKKIMFLYHDTETRLINAIEAKEMPPQRASEELKKLSVMLWNERDENSQSVKKNGSIELFKFRFFTRFTQIANSRRSRVYGWIGGKKDFNSEIYILAQLNAPTLDILDHPLYQQTLKDVLSENEHAQYMQIQAERDIFHQQALCDLVVADLDILIFLDDDQRKQLKNIASQLTVPPLIEDPQRNMFDQVIEQIENIGLSRWQSGYLNFYLSVIDEI